MLWLIPCLSLEDGSVRPTTLSWDSPGGLKGRPAAPDPRPHLRLFLGPPRALDSSLQALSPGTPAVAVPCGPPASCSWLRCSVQALSVQICSLEKSDFSFPRPLCLAGSGSPPGAITHLSPLPSPQALAAPSFPGPRVAGPVPSDSWSRSDPGPFPTHPVHVLLLRGLWGHWIRNRPIISSQRDGPQ